MFVLFNMLFAIAAGIVDAVLGTDARNGAGLFGSLYALAMLLPSLAVGVRRLHDTGKSGWWMLLGFVPLANIALLVFFIQDGTVGANQYGPDPKANVVVAESAGTVTGTAGAVAGSTATAPAGWFADPTGRHQLRYWDASQWTHHVSDNGTVGSDPV